MRQDQFEKLQALEERLTDVFIDEAEPARWPGKDRAANKLTQKMRGDRYWCKKNAVATIALVQRVAGLIQIVRVNGDTPPLGVDGIPNAEESHLDTEIASAEKEATALLDKMQRGAGKAEFDARTHGKP